MGIAAYLLLCILFVIPVTVYADIMMPEDYDLNSELLPNAASSDELSVSIDKFTYDIGDFVSVYGFVSDSKRQNIYLDLISPYGEKITTYQTYPTSEKIFNLIWKIPPDLADGRYTIVTRISSSSGASIDFILETGQDVISIPLNSFNTYSKLSFDPSTFSVPVGSPIKWKNDDITIHVIKEGRPYVTGDIEPLFDSRAIRPGETFEVLLPEGQYQYYCSIHPWTVGFIEVYSSADATDETDSTLQSTSIVNVDVLKVKTDLQSYQLDQEIIISGKITKFEPNSKLIIQVADPDGNLVFVEQLDPIQDMTCCYESPDKKQILAKDNIAPWFTPWKEQDTVIFQTANIADFQEGTDALQISVDTSDGVAAGYHDYGTFLLQDWSGYDYLSFWYKGENIQDKAVVILRDKTWASTGGYVITEDSPGWKQVLIPLKSTYPTMDLSKVRALEMQFKVGITDGEILVDNIEIVQLIPESSGSFDYTLSKLAQIFTKDGGYKITTMYGDNDYIAEAFFTIEKPELVDANYKGFNIYQTTGKFYAIPIDEGELILERIKNDDYSKIISAQSLDDLVTILSPFPVSQQVLLAVWNDRDDLQKIYPEVTHGDLSNLQNWALTMGWNEDYRLVTLTPESSVPSYELEEGKILAKDNIAPWFTPWKEQDTVIFQTANIADFQEGTDALQISVDTSDGVAAGYHDYGTFLLQDWSGYDYLSFWYKGENIQDKAVVILRDKTWASTGGYVITEDSPGWKQVLIPLKSTYPTMDLSQVRALEIQFKVGITNGKMLVDNFKVLTENALKEESEKSAERIQNQPKSFLPTEVKAEPNELENNTVETNSLNLDILFLLILLFGFFSYIFYIRRSVLTKKFKTVPLKEYR